MSRIQLALNVPDLDEAVTFYTALLGVPPAKRREGCANFVASDPPVKLVLVERAGGTDRLNHLGIEVESVTDVALQRARLAGAGLSVGEEHDTTCCHALQDKFWVDGGDTPWEVYTVLADVDGA